MKKLVASCLIFTFFINQSLISALAADIVVGGPLPTDTSISTNGNITNIQTNTTVNSGQIGINSFDRFNVNQGDIVNLNLINNQNKLVNLIFDSSASQINGVVNSYLNGQIGGNVLFANPNGFVIGEHGVFNVGSLTLMTPTENSMKELINSSILGGDYNETKIERLISFTFNDENYLVTGNEYEPYELASGKIEIAGQINSAGGIDLISGSEVNLLSSSELNANMTFSSVNNTVIASPSTAVSPESTTKFPTNLAMQNGKDIVIVASNPSSSKDVLSAIVNLNGKVNANNGDIFVKTETFQTDDAGNSKSQILVQENANISADDILMQAISKVTDCDKNLINLSQSSIDNYYGYAGELVNGLGGNFVHIANVDTKVIIEKGATINAINNFVIDAISDLDISASTLSAALAFNYTSIDAITETIIKQGANITAKNLEIVATTDLELSTSTKASSLLDEKIHNKYGNISGSLTLEKLTNRAIIEEDVNLNISDNLSIIAETISNHSDTTKNGLIPIVDKNSGIAGVAAAVILAKIINEACLDSDVTLENGGIVNVEANYTGKISSNVTAYSGGEGENTTGLGYGITFVKSLLKGSGTNDLTAMQDQAFESMKARGNADFGNLNIAGAVGVAINNVVSKARIGNSDSNIKPQIKAGNVNVSSSLIDNKSDMSVIANAENGKTTIDGALAINYKDLNSDATVFSDITLVNSETNFTTATNNIVKGQFYQADESLTFVDQAYYEKLEESKRNNYREFKEDLYYETENKSNVITLNEYNKLSDEDKKAYALYEGTMYQNIVDIDLISAEQYNKLSNEEQGYYSKFEADDVDVFGYGHYDSDKLKFTTDTDKKKDHSKVDGTFYSSQSGDIITDNKYNLLSDNEKQTYSLMGCDVYTLNPTDSGVNIKSSTEIIHPLSYYDWWPEFTKTLQTFFSEEHWDFAGNEVKNQFNNIESNNVSDYLTTLGSVSGLSNLMNDLDFDLIIYGIGNLDNLGLASLFNTFAQSTSSAKTTTGETKAVAGAIAVGVFDAVANAILMDNSSITQQQNINDTNINIDAYTNNEIWTMGTLLKPIDLNNPIGQITSGMPGMAARDGSAYGAGVAFSFSNSDTIAKIGENVSITNSTNKSNNLSINAKSDGNYVNVTAASSSADDAGMSGAVGATVITGETIAAIEKSIEDKSINVDKAKINADKDANYINAIIAFANSEETTGWGIASTTITDNVNAYIAGNLNVNNDLNVLANYDKLLVNISTNLGIAKKGTDAPLGATSDPETSWLKGTFLDDIIAGMPGNEELAEFDAYKQQAFKRTKTINSKMKTTEEYLNRNYDFERNANPDKKTASKAGSINATVTTNKVESYIADGAKIKVGNNLKVSATQSDKLIDAGIVAAANGKTGAGATVMADIIANDTRAYIGAAEVDVSKNILVNAHQETYAVAASAGIAQANDSSGVGNLSSIVYVNDVTADIKSGAKINKKVSTNTQSIDVNASMDSFTAKGVGALSIQSGVTNTSDAKSKGATLDGDVVVNSIRASIDGADINVSEHLNVNANNNDRFIGIDMAGVASTQGSAYGGVIAGYVAANTIDSFINNTKINMPDNTELNKANNNLANINVSANSDFREIVVAGTVAGGKETGVGATLRTDVVINEINTYIKDSTVYAKDVNLTNNEQLHQISVAVAGAGSSSESAGAGVANVFADITTQNTYIDNSTLEVNSLNLDSDKTLFDVAVTGAIAASAGSSGTSIGASAYGVGVSHDINTYIKNSDITSTNDISLTSVFVQDSYNIIFGGAGGSGFTGSGAISVVVNNSNMNTYVLADSDSEKDELTSNDGKVTIKSESDINLLTVDGNVAISTSNSSAGAAVNTYVNNADITAGIDGATIVAKKEVDVLAESTQSQTSIVVGAAGGSETSAQGSIDTIVIAQNIDAYIKNATVKSGKDVKVKVEDYINSGSTTGAVGVAMSGLAVGASILTVSIAGKDKAYVVNTTFEDFDETNSLGDLIVKATQSDSFISGTIAGSAGSKAGVGGAIDTIVLNKTVSAYIDNVDNINDSEFKNITINANSNTDLLIIAGSLGIGGNVGVGGTVSTVVINKHIHSFIQNDSNVEADENISVKTNAEDNVTVAAVAGSGGGSYSVSGVVNTTVINSDMQSGIKNSTVNADKITVDTLATAHYDDISGAVSGAGTVGVGASITTNVIGYDLASYVDNSIVKQFGKLNVNAQAISNYDVYAISGAGGGTAGIAGVVETNVVNNTITAYVLGDIDGDELTVNALDTVNFNGMAGSLAGGATAGVGATISTNSVTSTILAYIGSTNEKHIKANDIAVKAQGIQNFNNLLAMGFGGGQVGVGGSSLVNIVDATVKSYIKENSSIESASNLKIEANDSTSITGSVVAGAGAQYVAGGASVGVNEITNTVEAYTENNVNLKLSKSEINATSITNLGTKDNKLYIAAGTAAAGGAATGAVLVNTVENNVNAYIGKKNNISSTGDLTLKAQADTNIYESVGGVAIGGVAGVGASVGVNNIDNTVNTLIGANSILNMPSGNLTLEAHSNEIIDATASIVGGGSVALSGGIIHNTIGKVVDNAQENALTGDDATVYETAKTQAENVLIASANELNNADKNYKEYSGTNTESTFSLFTKSENSGSSLGSTARLNTTSAFIDSGAKLNTKDASLYAKNTNDVDIKVSGNTYGAAAVGVSAGVSNVYTTTNAFISNNVVVDAEGKIDIKSESIDNQDVNVKSASGGIISGSGGLAKINSNKTTNTYVLSSSILEAIGDLLLDANSKGIVNSTVNGDSHGGVAVGVSVADAIIKGNTRIDIDDNVDLLSKEGNLTIKTNADEKSTAIADALSGSLLGGVGAEANAQTGKNNTVNIGKNTNILAKLVAKITSIGKNTSIAKTDGRAYGVVSAGGTMTNSNIKNTSGVSIADADANSNKLISAKSVDISSSVENNVDAQTKAGAGAAVGVGGSGVYTDIISTNDVVIGKNYSIKTTDGDYGILANTSNIYKSYNDSSAYGAVGVTVGIIANTVNSAVSAVSNADINANGAIKILATNSVKKNEVSNYDLYGGAGGVVGVGAANLTDNIIMSTIATLDGNKAYALGAFDNGYINISSQSELYISEKVDVTAGGAVPVADGKVQVKSDVQTKTYIKNKDIKTKDDDIYFLTNSDINIYTKSNVASYGGIAIADGTSIAENNKAVSSVIISSGVNSISGRDTYIQSVCNKNIQAYMYATTQGLIGVVGDSEAIAYNDSFSEISIEENAILKAYDSMNLTVLDKTIGLNATRKAKGTTYIVFGIPISIEGEGNETKKNDSKSLIILNGQLESGLGANRNLVINKDGSYTSNGINVIGKEKVGEVTSSDIQSDIDAYETTKNNKLKEIEDYISIEENIIDNATNTKNEAETQKIAYETKNQDYTNAISTVNNIIDNNNKIQASQNEINMLETIKNAWDNAYSLDENGKISIDSSFGDVLEQYENNQNITNLQRAWNDYSSEASDNNLIALQNCIDALNNLKTENANNIIVLSNENATLSNTVTNINPNVNCDNNIELQAFIYTVNNEIDSNNIIINNLVATIDSLGNEITEARENIRLASIESSNIESIYGEEITKLKQQQNEAIDSALPVYSLIVDDIIVRSGDTNINGKLEGNGSIIAPGNKFTIDIINNSVNDIVYNDIQIDRNVTGTIKGSDIASTITKTILNSNATYGISILNTVDANDPTINLNITNGFGDMVFRGNVENINGSISFINNTGNVLSEGSITAKDLKISVPNGSYAQTYTDNTVSVGGSSNTGAIIASGDIDIASKIIDINGLIQSGSEIKSVTIPNFKVVKEGDIYYQVFGSEKVEMQKGSTDGYYYLNLSGNGQLDSDLEMIKAYFKPSDESNSQNVLGDIHLFKAEIQGGNITLTGNIVSSSNNGKIVLINGYGHIDVNNNSNFNLVTSALNADANINGKLTINDFKFSDADKAGTSFDELTHEKIEDNQWLKEHAGTYTASVDNNGKIITTSSGKTTGNGQWGEITSSTREDGANINNVIYIPGNDAYIVTKAGSTETKSYQEYVKRSWWTELWHGKLYRTVYYTVTHKPEYGVAQNSVNVQFQGFSTPQINVNSNGSIIMNNSISALAGNIGLSSSNGSITTNSINNIISAQHINMSANNDIGSELKPIQAAIYNDGILSVDATNVYINYPNSEISNIIVNATGNAYLATSGSQLGGLDSEVSITANSLELRADNGSIQLDSTKNDKINIEVNKLKARANGDVALTNKGNLNISSIVSTSKGNIALGSETGSIIATDNETLNPYHINGGNVVIKALNGYVGTSDNVLKVARDGIYNVISNGDINIYSAGRIHADSIQSLNGKVNLDADYGIIAATSSESLIYNIYSATGVDLNTKHGNIENIAINTDGVINAIAGYTDGIASGMSDISISLISKKEISQEYLATLTSDSEREAALNAYTAGLKDMKLGNVKASRNVIVNSEKSILNANNSSSLTGSQIVLSAVNGNVGTSTSALKINALKDVTVFAGNDKNVYLTTDNDLNINEIRSVNTYDSTTKSVNTDSVLGNVVLSAKGNITNSANDDRVNIKANNIKLSSNKDIGTSIKYLNVNTISNDINNGLSANAINAYINGKDSDLNIISSEISNNLILNTENNTSLAIQDVRVGNQLTAKSASDVNITGTIVANKSLIQAQNTTDINNANIEGIFNNESEALVVNNAELNTLTTSSTTANIANMVVSGDANITTTDKTTIANATVDGNLVNNSKDTEVTNKLTVGGNTSISAIDSIAINDASIYGYLNTIANTLKIDEIMLVGNINANVDNANIYTSEDLNIGNISGNKNAYTTALDIRSEKSIYNGLDTDDYNLYAKDITLKANETIGTLDNPLNIMLANGNKLSMVSDNLISLSTNGTGANYSNIETKAFAIYTDDDINIKNINVEQAKITTSSNNLSIDNLIVEKSATLTTGNKRVIIDNTSLKPIINADVQLYLTQLPASIKINGDNNIITEAVNVTRHNSNILVNSDNNNNSMNSAINSSSATSIKNTNVSEKTIEKTEALLYKIPTQGTYKTNIEKSYGEGIIKNHVDEYVSPSNIFDVINNSKSKTSKIKYFHKISYDNIKYKKVSSL